MKHIYYFFFIAYFFISLIVVYSIHFIFFHWEISQEYDARYSVNEDFLNLDLTSWKQAPFLRFHRWEDITSSWTIAIQKDIEYWNDKKFQFFIFPEDFYEQISQWYLLYAIDTFLKLPFIYTHIDTLDVLFFNQESSARGKMFRQKIYLYSLDRILEDEAISVFIHEFWHYYDIYKWASQKLWNISKKFYEISWQDTDIIKAWQSVNDFVSWYAMSNKYEDFAESYTYYILHNSAFKEKALESSILARKYDFFKEHTFPEQQFYMKNFWKTQEILPYYWDITKITIDVKKFLQYINIYL